MSKTIEKWKAASGYYDLLAAHSAALTERDALRAEVERLRTFVDTLRADGLDIDDPVTAPTWTGKIHAPDGRLLFDLATARESE